MNEKFYEQLVKGKTDMKKITLIIAALVVVIFAVLLFVPPSFSLLIVIVLLGLAYYFVYPKMRVEYEYLIVNSEFSIDVIYNQAKRKEFFKADLKDVEKMVPAGTPAINNLQAAKTIDAQGYGENLKVYCLVLSQNTQRTKVLITPDEKMLKEMKMWLGVRYSEN